MISLILKREQLFFLLLCTSFFSINSLLINPTYVAASILFLFAVHFMQSKISNFIFTYIIYCILISINFIIGLYVNKYTDPVFMSSFLYLYSIITGLIAYILGAGLPKCERIKKYKLLFIFLTFFMLIDLLIRLLLGYGSSDFYAYKFGIFYWDSNFSGIIILLFLMYMSFLKELNIYFCRPIFLLLLLLLLLSFSRSAIFIFVICFILMKFPRALRSLAVYVFCIICMIIFVSFVALYFSGINFIAFDGSFNSKFYLILLAINNYDNLSFSEKIFGLGMNNFQQISNGYFAHNILITYIYEFGILGTGITIMWFIFCYKKLGFSFNYILLPYILVGFSLFSAYSSVFFILLACIALEVRTKNQELTNV